VILPEKKPYIQFITTKREGKQVPWRILGKIEACITWEACIDR